MTDLERQLIEARREGYRRAMEKAYGVIYNAIELVDIPAKEFPFPPPPYTFCFGGGDNDVWTFDPARGSPSYPWLDSTGDAYIIPAPAPPRSNGG